MVTNTAEGSKATGLTLYGYPQCPYCRRVLDAIEGLGLDVPLQNTIQDPAASEAVFEATGRGTVPVLRIEHPDGRVEWMPESADIVRYLISRFG